MISQLAKSGSARIQMVAARLAYEADPANLTHAVEYGQSLVKYGLCERMLDVMGPIWEEPEVPVGMVYAMAQCYARIGLYEDALYFDQRGLERDDSRVRGLTLIVLHADALGRSALREEAFYELEGLGTEGGDSSLLAEATMALRKGDIETLDICLALWSRSGWNKRDADRLNAQAWLDLGDPQETLESTNAFRANRQDGRFIYAEAYRRLGEYPTTIFKLENVNQRVAEGASSDAILARAYVDAGNLEHAREILEPYEGAQDTELVATRWYLARAEKNELAMQAEAAEWARLSPNALRKLDQLDPW